MNSMEFCHKMKIKTLHYVPDMDPDCGIHPSRVFPVDSPATATLQVHLRPSLVHPGASRSHGSRVVTSAFVPAVTGGHYNRICYRTE